MKKTMIERLRFEAFNEKQAEEPLSERMYLGMTPSMKSAIIEKVMTSRKPGETIHGAISAYIREAIVLHLARQ